MFYTYRQNNSYGEFKRDDATGIGVFVIVEAADAVSANLRAESIGLYFDGAGDCPCCGARWSEAYDPAGTEAPSIWGEDAFGAAGHLGGFVHYADGRIVSLREARS